MSIQRFKYSWEWSSGIVDLFVEKYARGTLNLAKILNIDTIDVRKGLTIWLARGNSIRFEALKRLIKDLQRSDWEDYKHLDRTNRRILYKRYLYCEEDNVLDAKIASEGIDT